MKTIQELKIELDRLLRVGNDPRVQAAKAMVQAERLPQVTALEAQINKLRDKRPEKKPRWPQDTPSNVLEVCKKYWNGTVEYATFRIHCWNDKLVCTSYPSGGYSTVGGWTPTPACFHFISLSEIDGFASRKPKRIGQDLEGRQSSKVLETTLNERSKIS